MKFTRNKAAPVITPPDTFTLELSLDEMIFLKSMCSYYTTIFPTAKIVLPGLEAAKRFIKLIPEAPWSWGDTDILFK
jgi:hypothetical protein